MKEYAFDVTLYAVARVTAANEKEAREKMTNVVDCIDLNFDHDGVRLTEACSAHDVDATLFEIDGEPHNGGTYRSPAAWLERATNLLAESLDKWEDEEASVQEEKADHIAELNQFFDDWNASKPKPGKAEAA